MIYERDVQYLSTFNSSINLPIIEKIAIIMPNNPRMPNKGADSMKPIENV